MSFRNLFGQLEIASSVRHQSSTPHPLPPPTPALLLPPSLPTIPPRHPCALYTDLCSQLCPSICLCIVETSTLNITCKHFKYLTQSQYTDTRPSSLSADPTTPGTWQGSHWSANYEVTGMTGPGKIHIAKVETEPRSASLEVDAFTTGPVRWSASEGCDRK